MKTILFISQIGTVLLTGLLAGLLYGYQCSVNKGLGNLSDSNYLSAFQSINRAILHPIFFLSFMGSIVLLIITIILSYKTGNSSEFYILLSSLTIYIVGVFGVTIFGNVPLNEQLARFTISSASEDAISQMRKTFETPWNSFHLVRTICSIITFCLAILSLKHK